MAMVGLRVPQEIARLLSDIPVQGDAVDSATYHVTLLNLGDDVSVGDLMRATEATYEVVSEMSPFTVKLDQVSHFDKGENGFPVICRVSAETLTDLHGRLWEAFEKAGIEFSRKFPDFNGHVTLAYQTEGKPLEFAIPPIHWTVCGVVLWGGDTGEEKLVTSFPLGLEGVGKTALYRAAVRLAGCL